jgi:L-arabinose isomerase
MALPIRVALCTTYFALLEQGMSPSFRGERLRFGEMVRQSIEKCAAVDAAFLIDSAETAVQVGCRLADLDVDVVVVAPTMATPPDWVVSALRRRADLPVILLAIREQDSVPDDYDTEQGTSNSLLVGVTMLCNAFLRERRVISLIIGTQNEDDWREQFQVQLAAAGAVRALAGSRLLVGGKPIGGYSDVEVTEDDLARLRVSTCAFDGADLARYMTDVSDDDREAVVQWAIAQGEVAVDSPTLDRSAVVACALRRLARAEGVIGGTVNCHGPVFRGSEQVGITACLAVTALAHEGLMFSCTGDIPVAVALILGRQLAGAALYCELYAVDRPGDWILVANGGEGDLGYAQPQSVRFLPEHHYAGVHGPGVATAFDVQLGPATLVSMSPLSEVRGGWRMIVMEGDVIGSHHRRMEGPNAMFRPVGASALEGFGEWARLGAPHHAALLPGRWGSELESVAAILRIDHRAVSAIGPSGAIP